MVTGLIAARVPLLAGGFLVSAELRPLGAAVNVSSALVAVLSLTARRRPA
jgi:hypothetical protein